MVANQDYRAGSGNILSTADMPAGKQPKKRPDCTFTYKKENLGHNFPFLKN